MSTSTLNSDEITDDFGDDAALPNGRALRVTLWAIIAFAVLVLAGTLGYVLRGGSTDSSAATPSTSSVDAGFARDMSTHHTQAVTMAGYERDNTSSPVLKTLAFDIESAQQFQVGEMQGWLDDWGLSRNSSQQMAWMGHDMAMGPNALMPGMASAAQINRLDTLHGKALDVLFLQLMIHHHQGGVAMAAYARDHASEPYVAQLAGTMYALQSQEIIQMEQQLRQLGGQPLPPPSI